MDELEAAAVRSTDRLYQRHLPHRHLDHESLPELGLRSLERSTAHERMLNMCGKAL